MTRSIAKTCTVKFAPQVGIQKEKKTHHRLVGTGARYLLPLNWRADFSSAKRLVNNPWGNKGRKKCPACRSRKRGVVSPMASGLMVVRF